MPCGIIGRCVSAIETVLLLYELSNNDVMVSLPDFLYYFGNNYYYYIERQLIHSEQYCVCEPTSIVYKFNTNTKLWERKFQELRIKYVLKSEQ